MQTNPDQRMHLQIVRRLVTNFSFFIVAFRSARQGMVWNGMENGMEYNGNFGMEYGRCQNGMEWKISRMEWKTIFHTSTPIPY